MCRWGSCPAGGSGKTGQHEEERPTANRHPEAHWHCLHPSHEALQRHKGWCFAHRKFWMPPSLAVGFPPLVSAAPPCPPALAPKHTLCPSHSRQPSAGPGCQPGPEVAAASGPCWPQPGGRTGPHTRPSERVLSPSSLTQVIRKFAKQLDEWLKVALHDLPENLRNIKFERKCWVWEWNGRGKHFRAKHLTWVVNQRITTTAASHRLLLRSTERDAWRFPYGNMSDPRKMCVTGGTPALTVGDRLRGRKWQRQDGSQACLPTPEFLLVTSVLLISSGPHASSMV